MSRTWLLVDVDGVISPVRASDAWPDFEPVPEAPYHLLVSEQMGRALADLPARRFWLTTWDDLANEYVAPALGWSELPVVRRGTGRPGSAGGAKLAGVQSLLAEADERPDLVLWCEDELALPQLREDAKKVLGDVPHELIAPDPGVGLTPEHVERLERRIEEL